MIDILKYTMNLPGFNKNHIEFKINFKRTIRTKNFYLINPANLIDSTL